jgi:arylsulfatase A-like enzyme
MGGRSVHFDRWHYVAWTGGVEALFDMKSDPWQMQNLVAKPEHAATLARMRTLLKEHAAGGAPPKPQS